MKKTMSAIILSVGLVSCGTKTIVKEVPQSTNAPVVTSGANKYEQYVDFVKANSGQAYSYTDAQLIETGDLVCAALDSGKSIPTITQILEDTARNQSDIELFASVMYSAIQYICPEYKAALSSHLNGY